LGYERPFRNWYDKECRERIDRRNELRKLAIRTANKKQGRRIQGSQKKSKKDLPKDKKKIHE